MSVTTTYNRKLIVTPTPVMEVVGMVKTSLRDTTGAAKSLRR